MNVIKARPVLFSMCLLATTLIITACGIASEVVNHEANDRRLLKPGALDPSMNETYIKYQYNFINQYKITHDFPMEGGCAYHVGGVGISDIPAGLNYAFRKAPDVFDIGNHTYVDVYTKKDTNHFNPINIDQYTRSEFANGTDSQGNIRMAKGFQPMCFQTWQGTQHFLTIYLNKRTLELPNIYGFKEGVISHEKVGNNDWWVQKFDYQPYKINSSGRVVESWVLPIADTGYMFIFEFGANQDSLQHPQAQAHVQMQAIFKHLIESVKIEPISH